MFVFLPTLHAILPLTYINSFYTMMSDKENIGIALLFTAIFIPGMIWTALDYKPDDTMGRISAVLIWCGCCFFVLLSPLSILLYFFYRWLFKWIKSVIRNKRASKVTRPASISCPASSVAPSAQKNVVSYSHRVCENIWSELDAFVKNIDPSLDRRKQLYLWGIYFYVVVKTVKDQRFINDIYSHFDCCAVKRIVDATSRPDVVHNLRQLYREIRIPLNQSKIDPTTEAGLAKLWEFTSKHLYEGSTPPQAKNRFTISVSFLKQLSMFCYSKYKEESVFSTVRYSISEPCDDSELPNE